MTTPQQLAYASEYIRAALGQDKVEAPDQERANGTWEVLTSIYEAHQRGGTGSAKTAWETAKKFRPEFAGLDLTTSKLIHASQLKYLSKPETSLAEYPFYDFGFNLLVGPSGAGKSFVALDFAGKVAQEHMVAYIAGEGLLSYRDRWEAWKDYTGFGDGKLYLHEEAVQLIDEVALQSFIDLVGPKQPRVIIVDTVARCAAGVDENSAKEMGMFVAACDRLRRELRCGVLAVHHTGKDGKIRGSSALYAAADAVLYQAKQDGRIMLVNNGDNGGKNKYDSEQPTRWLQILPHPLDGFEKGAVVVPIENVIQTRDDKLTTNQRAILEALDGYDKGLSIKSLIDATQIPQATVYRVVQRLMRTDLKFVEQDDTGERYVITEDGRDALLH